MSKNPIFTFLVLFLFLMITPHSFAKYSKDCSDRLKDLRTNILSVERPESLLNDPKAVNTLKPLELKTLKIYRRWLKDSGEETSLPIYITTFAYFNSSNTLQGYKIFFWSGDESGTSFFLTQKGELLFWFVNNQAPLRVWTCEVKN